MKWPFLIFFFFNLILTLNCITYIMKKNLLTVEIHLSLEYIVGKVLNFHYGTFSRTDISGIRWVKAIPPISCSHCKRLYDLWNDLIIFYDYIKMFRILSNWYTIHIQEYASVPFLVYRRKWKRVKLIQVFCTSFLSLFLENFAVK